MSAADHKEYYIKGELTVDGTGIIFQHPRMVAPILNKAFRGKILDIVIKEFFEKRSNQQNRYLHGVVLPIIINWRKETTGEIWTMSQAKAFIYLSVLDYKVESMIDNTGREIFWFEGKHFSDMSTKEFNQRKEEVQKYFAELGVDIPDPRGGCTINDYLN